jgi:acylphosphatase
MKKVLLSAVAVLVAFCFAVNAADEAKAQTLTGAVKVTKDGDKTAITLTVKDGEKETVYKVVDTKDGAVAKLDGKQAKANQFIQTFGSAHQESRRLNKTDRVTPEKQNSANESL